MLTGPELAPKSGNVKRAVIFLHGYGSNGDDLFGLAPMMMLPDTQFLSPNAPFGFEMYPGGYQWFGLADRDPVRILKEILVAAPILNAFINATIARLGITDSDVALVGFSQGSMMSMYTALRRPKPLAGVVAISGALKGDALLTAEIKSRPPICIIHGTADDVVSFKEMGFAEEILKSNNVPVESYARPGLGHGIDEEGIAISNRFLKKVFKL